MNCCNNALIPNGRIWFNLTLVFSFLVSMAVLVSGCGKKEQAKPVMPPTEVVAVTVQPQTVPAVFPFVAQIQSSHQVDVMARVSAFLKRSVIRKVSRSSRGRCCLCLIRNRLWQR